MILYRLTSAKPHYPTDKLIEDARKNTYMKERISQNARRRILNTGRNRPESAYSRVESGSRLRSATGGVSKAFMIPDAHPSFEIMKSNPTMKRVASNQIEQYECMDSVDGSEYRHR